LLPTPLGSSSDDGNRVRRVRQLPAAPDEGQVERHNPNRPASILKEEGIEGRVSSQGKGVPERPPLRRDRGGNVDLREGNGRLRFLGPYRSLLRLRGPCRENK